MAGDGHSRGRGWLVLRSGTKRQWLTIAAGASIILGTTLTVAIGWLDSWLVAAALLFVGAGLLVTV